MAEQDQSTTDVQDNGVVIRASNGDVIRYDDTGLVLRLSDKVLADIALRLGTQPSSMRPDDIAPTTAPAALQPGDRLDPHDFFPGVEAWGLSISGDWIYFTADLPGKQGVRGYRRPMDGGHIIADAPGPVCGIFGLGGARAALATTRPSHYPHHIMAPADDIGAVGHAGIEDASETDQLDPLREVTHEALVAETLLAGRIADHASLSLCVTRVETDAAATTADLATGVAQKNLVQAARNMAAAARSLGKPAQLLAITLDYTFEDQSGDAAAWRDGMLAVMENTERDLVQLGFHNPRFIARFDSGTDTANAPHVIQGQWDLGWNHGDHNFTFSAPSYMFHYDAYDRPTDDARQDMADMTAAALADPDWHCPTILLAERDLDTPTLIRVTAKAMDDLVLPPREDPTAGFCLLGTDAPVQITDVRLDPDDTKRLILTCDTTPTGDGVHLGYAYGGPQVGHLRDTWEQIGTTGRVLHRWALPCHLPLTDGGRPHVET